MSDNHFQVAIIGGGIVGTALARELASRFNKILLLEKETAVGLHTSGRNSGVIHSGFNAKPGTLKAQLCVEGSQMLRTYCKTRGIACQEIGTLVIAAEEKDIPRLNALKEKGIRNQVPDLEILDRAALRKQEPNALGEAANRAAANFTQAKGCFKI